MGGGRDAPSLHEIDRRARPGYTRVAPEQWSSRYVGGEGIPHSDTLAGVRGSWSGWQDYWQGFREERNGTSALQELQQDNG